MYNYYASGTTENLDKLINTAKDIASDTATTQAEKNFINTWFIWLKEELDPPGITTNNNDIDKSLVSYETTLAIMKGLNFPLPIEKAENLAKIHFEMSGILSLEQNNVLIIALLQALGGTPSSLALDIGDPKKASIFVSKLNNFSDFSFKPTLTRNETFVSLLIEASKPQESTQKKRVLAATSKASIFSSTSVAQISPGQDKSSTYIDNIDGTTGSPALSSYASGRLNLESSASLAYGMNFATDNQISYSSSSISFKKGVIYELAKAYGYEITEPIERWIVSTVPGGGQEFLRKLNEANVVLNITGSATMEVIYDGINEAAWKREIMNNYQLACQRAQLVIDYLNELNEVIRKEEGLSALQYFNFRSTPNGRVHFFQEFTGDQKNFAKQYGYVEGEGQKNLNAMMNFLKNISDISGSNQSFIIFDDKVVFLSPQDKIEAKEFYEKLTIDAIRYNSKTGNFEITNATKLDTYFKRKTGDPTLIGAGSREGMRYEGVFSPNIFVRAMTESTPISGRSVTVSSTVDVKLQANLEINDNKATISIDYLINNKKIDFNKRNGTLTAYIIDSNGSQTEMQLEVTDNKAEIDLQPGQKIAAVATTKDGKISSGFVWDAIAQPLPVESPPLKSAEEEIKTTYLELGKEFSIFNYQYARFPFYCAKKVERQGKTTYERSDAMIAFISYDLNKNPLGIISPGTNKVRKEHCYSVSDKEIAIIQSITINGQKLSKKELVDLVERENVVGFVKNGTNFALDGITELEVDSNYDIRDGFIYSKNKVSLTSKKVAFHEGMLRFYQEGKERDERLIPLYTILPQSSVNFGVTQKSKAEIARLAREGHVAIIENDANGVGTIFDLNGNELGKVEDLGRPDLANLDSTPIKGIFTIVRKEEQEKKKNHAPAPRGWNKSEYKDWPADYWFYYPDAIEVPAYRTVVATIYSIKK